MALKAKPAKFRLVRDKLVLDYLVGLDLAGIANDDLSLLISAET